MFYSVFFYQDKKTMSSSEDEVDSLFEESMVGRINSLEKFATEEFSKLKKRNQNLQDTLNERMTSDMAAVKAELSALKTRVADQDRQLQELKKELEDKTSGAPTHTEVQEKRPASSPDWTPEQKKSRSEEGLDKILEPFWPERPDARERLSERQQAFFLYMMDQLKVKGERALSLFTVWHENVLSTEVMSHDTNNSNVLIFLSDRRNLELNAATVQSEGVSRGVWDEDWSPERIQTSFTKYLEKKILQMQRQHFQKKELDRLRKMVDW